MPFTVHTSNPGSSLKKSVDAQKHNKQECSGNCAEIEPPTQFLAGQANKCLNHRGRSPKMFTSSLIVPPCRPI